MLIQTLKLVPKHNGKPNPINVFLKQSAQSISEAKVAVGAGVTFTLRCCSNCVLVGDRPSSTCWSHRGFHWVEKCNPFLIVFILVVLGGKNEERYGKVKLLTATKKMYCYITWKVIYWRFHSKQQSSVTFPGLENKTWEFHYPGNPVECILKKITDTLIFILKLSIVSPTMLYKDSIY